MVFLVQIKKTTSGTFEKGTSEFATEKEALTALYVAMSSAMNKDDTESIMCMLTDEYGSQKKKEFWQKPFEEESEEPAEEV